MRTKPGADSVVSAMEDGDQKPQESPLGKGGLHAIEDTACGLR
ncbi:hypothetical protein RBWH47_02338 [Rhodopirellula baltica WH47]|uniref:Uncharacterized protein n=1 Tax=Rhodopirellula baltica WH47 TaxID=991778 RepID=F2ARR7_RHOBT|nr:hypothetical protein RBWH47_02338 [Rhodopirellula baltica WH47]